MSLPRSIQRLRALTLPTRIAPYGSPRKLLTDIAELISEYTGLPENSIAAISRWALSSWFPEVALAPGLSLIGPDTNAGRQLLQLLHCFCRHPLLLTEVNGAGLRALPMAWQLTLLIQQPELSAEVQRILRTARRSMGFIPRGGRLLDFHCAVATYTELGGACGSGIILGLEIPVVPASQGLPVLDNDKRERIASSFQARLLGYRLANFLKVLKSALGVPDLTRSVRELAQGLSACTPDDADLQAQVPEFLRVQDKAMRSAAWIELNTVIIEAVLAFVHEAKEDCVYTGEIASAAEEILRGRGENRELEARAIGPKLAALGFITEERNSHGIRLVLTREVSRHVHELAYYFSVPSVQDGLKRCDHCKQEIYRRKTTK